MLDERQQKLMLAAPRSYVGTLSSKYPPAKAKMKSGAQAASIAGSWLADPMASNTPAVTQYTMAIPIAMATPASAPPRRPDAANGIARTAITRVIKGNA